MSQPPLQHRSFISAAVAFLLGSDPKYRERSTHAIVRMLILVCVMYAIGAALFYYWPVGRSTYESYFRGFGNAAFERFLVWPTASIRFLDLNSRDIVQNIRDAAPPLTLPESFPVPQRDRTGVKDTLMLLKNVHPAHPGLGQLRTGSRLIGFWPTITVLCLALATPWSWRRKTWLVVWVFLMVHLFIIFRLSIYALQGGFAVSGKDFQLLSLSEFWTDRLKGLDSVINDNPTTNFIAPILIWLTVVVGMELWSVLWKRISGAFQIQKDRRDPSMRMDRGRRRARI